MDKQFKCNHCGRLCHFIVKRGGKDTFIDNLVKHTYNACPVSGVAEWKVRKPQKKAVAASSTSSNTGYMAAVWKELRKRQGGPLPLKQNWIYVTEARLNAALKAAQHCM